jgi:TatD family-associated radical SAM protein
MRLDVVLAVTEWLRVRRLRSRLDTNGHGQLLNPDVEVVAALAAAGLDAATVSLNAADPESYDLICRPIFSKAHRAVVRFAERCVVEGIETTVTAVDYPGADLEGCAAIAAKIGAAFRVRGLVPPPGRGGGGRDVRPAGTSAAGGGPR